MAAFGHLGALGLFFLAILDSSPLPTFAGTDVLIIILVATRPHPWYEYSSVAILGSVHRGDMELVMMVQAGLTPLQAISVARNNGAQLGGVAASTGHIARQEGQLLCWEMDPSQEIHNTQTIRAVWKNGALPEPDRQQWIEQDASNADEMKTRQEFLELATATVLVVATAATVLPDRKSMEPLAR